MHSRVDIFTVQILQIQIDSVKLAWLGGEKCRCRPVKRFNLSLITSTSLANEEPAPIIHQPLQKINSEPVKHWKCNTIFCLDQIKYKIYLALDK